MQKQIVLKIFGKVQGVFFRDSSRKKAKELNLFGCVRNKPDGTVEIVAEWEEGKLQEFIRWCKGHPGYSKVEKMDVEWRESAGNFGSFAVK